MTSNEAESAYKILIDKNEYSQNPINRGHRVKSLLSGGFGRPAVQPPPPMFPIQNQQQQQPPPQQQLQQQQQPFPPQLQQQPSLLPMFQQQQQPNRFLQPFQSQNYTPNYLQQPAYPGSLFSGLRPKENVSKHHHRHHHKERHHKTRKWYDQPTSRRSSRKSSKSVKSRHSRSSSSSSSSGSGSSSSSSDSSSSSNSSYRKSRQSTRRSSRSSRRGLNPLQKKILLNKIREYMPDKNLHDVIYQDLTAQMDLMDKKGFRLPKGYDKHKHDISDNEIRLYEQQLERDKGRDKSKVSYMINFSALGLNWFCQCIQVDWIKTKHFPEIIRTALEDGEFDDCLEGIGMYLRGSVFDNPIFSTVLKFVEKIGESHHQEMEEEQEKLEKEEERKSKRHADALQNMQKFRQGSSHPPPLDVPPPKKRTTAATDTESDYSRQKKMS